MKICVCIPNSFGYFQQEFAMSLLTLQSTFFEWVIANKRDDTLSFIVQSGVQLDEMRNDLVKSALAAEQTHLLFLDADMSFPADIIQKMIEDFEDNPEIEAVTGIYTWKRPPYAPHVYLSFDKKDRNFRMAGQFPMNSLFQVAGAATGCLMVRADVFARTAYPWFRFGTEGIEEYADLPVAERPFLGEDLFFCLKAKPLILCDSRILCEHYKMRAYTLDDYIDSNGLQRTEDGFTGTAKQLDKIGVIHSDRLERKAP